MALSINNTQCLAIWDAMLNSVASNFSDINGYGGAGGIVCLTIFIIFILGHTLKDCYLGFLPNVGEEMEAERERGHTCVGGRINCLHLPGEDQALKKYFCPKKAKDWMCDCLRNCCNRCTCFHGFVLFRQKYDKIYGDNYRAVFDKAFLKLSAGFFIFLLSVMMFYQILYSRNQYQQTYLGNSNYQSFVGIQAVLGAVFGALSSAFLAVSRNGWKGLQCVPLTSAAVGLTIFTFVQEASGLNRVLQRSDLLRGVGPYAVINGIDTLSTCQQQVVRAVAGGGDSFANAIAATTATLLGFSAVYQVRVMVITSVYGFLSGKHDLVGQFAATDSNCIIKIKDDTHFSRTRICGMAGHNHPYVVPILFVFECLVVGACTVIPTLLGPVIRQESVSGVWSIAGITFAATVLLQCMFQYVGRLTASIQPSSVAGSCCCNSNEPVPRCRRGELPEFDIHDRVHCRCKDYTNIKGEWIVSAHFAKYYCNDCQEGLCDDALKYHNGMAFTVEHVADKIHLSSNKCQGAVHDYPKPEATHVCLDCGEFFCWDCKKDSQKHQQLCSLDPRTCHCKKNTEPHEAQYFCRFCQEGLCEGQHLVHYYDAVNNVKHIHAIENLRNSVNGLHPCYSTCLACSVQQYFGISPSNKISHEIKSKPETNEQPAPAEGAKEQFAIGSRNVNFQGWRKFQEADLADDVQMTKLLEVLHTNPNGLFLLDDNVDYHDSLHLEEGFLLVDRAFVVHDIFPRKLHTEDDSYVPMNHTTGNTQKGVDWLVRAFTDGTDWSVERVARIGNEPCLFMKLSSHDVCSASSIFKSIILSSPNPFANPCDFDVLSHFHSKLKKRSKQLMKFASM
jgi:hypothetical protein